KDRQEWDSSWYVKEARVAARLGVSLEDLNGCSAGRLPSVYTVRELLRILELSDYPILFHCNRGVDRTGIGSAIALPLFTDAAPAEARGQPSLLHGHLRWGRPGHIDRFFDLYDDWLAAQKQAHSRPVFRRWLAGGYCPGEGRAKIALCEPGEPVRLSAYRPNR